MSSGPSFGPFHFLYSLPFSVSHADFLRFVNVKCLTAKAKVKHKKKSETDKMQRWGRQIKCPLAGTGLDCFNVTCDLLLRY